MKETIFNDAGVPMMGYGESGTFISTTGVPTGKSKFPKRPAIKNMAKPKDDDPDSGIYKNQTYVEWGTGNNMPDDIEEIIGKTGVLQTGLRYNMRLVLGQGVYPVKVLNFDTDGNEELEVITDPKLRQEVQGFQTLTYLEKVIKGLFKFAVAFVEFIPTKNGKQISGVNVINEKYCRLTEANKRGDIKKLIVSGDWPDSPTEANTEMLDVLNEYDPLADLQGRIQAGTFKKSVVMVIRDNFSNNDYYPAPAWWTAKEAGWLDIANKVPRFLKAMYENQITWKWHVKIPYAYWEKRYPKDKFKNEKERRDLITSEMDSIEKSLVGTDNAHKALFSMFEINQNGKAEEQWEIEAIDNKYKADDKLITSAVANSEILFTLLVNPTILGAGMPGSGPYSNSSGSGSDIREAFLVNVALSWLDRQKILFPLEFKYRINGYSDMELRMRNTVLTTLDKGAGSEKTLS